jgi:hypothetical protein
VDFTVEPEGAGLLVKLQTAEWEANVHASTEELLRLSDIRSVRWSERRSISAGESAGVRVYWSAGERDHANLMIGHDDETWDVSVIVPFTIIDQIVQAARGL